VTTTARDLGASPIVDGTVDAALRYGTEGGLVENLRARVAARAGRIQLHVPLAFDETAALAELERLAPELERPSLPTRLDLDARKVLPSTRGTSLLAPDSLSAIAVGLAQGADAIELVVHTKDPVEDPLAPLAADLDISTVVGRFSTRYQEDASYADRAYNLKVGAQAIDGTVILPGETLSFNAVVGDRSSEAGYRYAGGITGGELIDVVGGGICQISSTLYGASFFAGLEFGAYRPHSRPSTYVDMGLDSTVVYGSQDLELRNDFDFPIVIHMTVKSGVVEAEILGARRPYQVTFERTLDEAEPFKVVEREDSSLREGTTKVSQRGMRGFRLTRKRILSQGGSVVETETSKLYYPPTTEIVHRGTNPTGALPEQQALHKLRDPQPSLKIQQ
jgi:vancomycin resistance protein YoaR